MKALVTADLHFSIHARDMYRHDFVDRLCRLIEKRGITLLIVLGDLCENKDNHPAALVNKVVEHFIRLSGLCRVIIMKGNHDYYLDPTNPFYAFLGHIENITWINNPTAIKLDGLGQVLFLPHTPKYQDDWKDIDFRGRDWIFAHNTFTGARSEHGKELTGIPVSVFPKNARVISGDIHSPQDVGPVTYVGAPYLVDFGDNYTPRVLLIQDGEEIYIKMGGTQKRLIEVAGVEDVKKQMEHCQKGDILKIRVSMTQKRRAAWPEMKKEILDWGTKHGFVVQSVIPVSSIEPAKTKKPTTTKTDADIMNEHADKHSLDDRTLKIGLSFL